MSRERILIVCLVWLLGMSGPAMQAQTGENRVSPARGEDALALIGGTIWTSPNDEPIPDGVLLIRGGRIVAVGPGAAVAIPSAAKQIDCRGMVVVAGFWNSHVHFIQRKWQQAATLPAGELAQQLQEMLTQHGFTTVFDTGSMWENTRALRQRVESGEVAGPAIFTSGEILLPKGGQFPAEVMRTMGFMPLDFPELADAETARTRAKSMLESGVDALKIYAGTWMGPQVVMPVEMVRAIAEEAHRYNRLVIAHPSNLEGIRAALDGGADALVHTAPASGRWSNELVAEMKKRNMALIPTLKLWKYEARHDRILLRQMLTDAAVEQLRGFHQAGGTVLFGTDVGYMEDYDPIEEFALMARAGMDFRQILASLTSAPAERFGRAKRKGELRPGMDADVVVLDGDPRKDVRAFARVKYTVRVGSVIFSAP